MADRVLISFDAEIGDNMLSAVDFLVKIGVIDAGVGEQFKKTNAVFKERQKAIQDIKTAQTGTSVEVDKSVKSYDNLDKKIQSVANNIAKGTLADVSKEVIEVTADELQKAGLSYDQFIDKVKNGGTKAEQGTLSLRTTLRKLKEELTLLEDQGKSNTAEFEQMAIKAAKLEDQLGDTQVRIRNMADDSRGLKTIVEGLTGIASGFQIVQGAAALFGDENEELQKTLVKLNAVMAIANGLTQLNTILQKESFISTAATNLQRRASVIATQLETAVESENIIVKYAAIAAQKALNLVMAAPAPALLLTLIGGIAAALVFFTDSSEDATKQQEKFNKELELTAELSKQSIEFITKNSNEEIKRLEFVKARAEQEKKSLQEVRDIELQIESARRIAAQQTINAAQQITASLDDQKEQRQTAQLELIDLQQKESQQHDENTQKQIDGKKAQIKALTDLIDLQENAFVLQRENTRTEIQSQLEFEQKVTDLRLSNAKAVAEKILIESKAGTTKELSSKIDVINKERDIQLEAAKNNADEIALVNARADESIKKTRSEFISQRLSEEKTADEIRLSQITKDSQEELDLKVKIIKEESEIELSAFGRTEQEKINIRNTAIQKEIELRREFAEKLFRSEVNVQKNDAERRIAIARAGSEEELVAKKESIEEQLALDVAAINKGGELTKEQWAEINRLQAEALRKQEDLQKSHDEKELNDAKTHADLLIQIEQSKLRGKLNNPNTSADDKASINAQLLAEDKKLIDNEEALERARFALGIISYQEFQNALLKIKKERIDNENALSQLQAEQEKQTQQEIENFVIRSGQSVANYYFQTQHDTRQANLEEEIDIIENETQTLLKNKRVTEEEKEKIEKVHRERTAKAKLAAWEADRDASAQQAGVNGLVAITKTYAEYGNTPAAVLAIAALIIETGLQVAAIKTQSPPKYFKGTDYVTLDGNKPGVDTVPAMLTEGEGVDTVDVNRDYSPALKAIRRRKVSPAVVNKIITEMPGDVRLETIAKVMQLIKNKSIEVEGVTIKSTSMLSNIINENSNSVSDTKSVSKHVQSVTDRSDIVSKDSKSVSDNTSSASSTNNISQKVTDTSGKSATSIRGTDKEKTTSVSDKSNTRLSEKESLLISKSAHALFTESEAIRQKSIEKTINKTIDKSIERYYIPSMLDKIPEIVKFTNEDFAEITNISSSGIDINYEKLSDAVAEKLSRHFQELASEIVYHNRKTFQSGLPISNLGQVVEAINESNKKDPYLR